VDLKGDVVWSRKQQQEKDPHWKDLHHRLTLVFYFVASVSPQQQTGGKQWVV